MKTYQDTLIASAFEGKFPPWSTPSEVADFYERNPDPPQMKRAYQLGLLRKKRGLTPEEIVELDSLSLHPDFYARWEVHNAKALEEEREIKLLIKALGEARAKNPWRGIIP